MQTRAAFRRPLSRLVLAALTVALMFGSLPAPLLHAQDAGNTMVLRVLDGEPASKVIGSIGQETPIVLRFVGQGTSAGTGGTVTVASNGDITLKTGPVGGSAADTTTECPVSGALGGVIDVSDTACDTLGEVCDAINLPSSNWRCVILDGLRTDSSDDTLAALSEAAAGSTRGRGLLADPAVSFKTTAAIVPERNMEGFLEGPSNYLVTNPDFGRRTVLLLANGATTYGSGTSTLNIYSVAQKLSRSGGSEVVTTLYSAPMGATTVQSNFDFSPYGIFGRKGEKVVVRITNSAAMSAAALAAYGFSYRYR